jgi:hypothetical protein
MQLCATTTKVSFVFDLTLYTFNGSCLRVGKVTVCKYKNDNSVNIVVCLVTTSVIFSGSPGSIAASLFVFPPPGIMYGLGCLRVSR